MSDAEDWAKWKEIKAFHAQHGHWPGQNEHPTLNSFLFRMRRYMRDELKGQDVDAKLIKEMRESGVLERPSGANRRGARGGPLARVRIALDEGIQPDSKDIAQLRSSYREGRMSERTMNELKAAGLDIG